MAHRQQTHGTCMAIHGFTTYEAVCGWLTKQLVPSKSAMKVDAPLFSALMTILRSTGPCNAGKEFENRCVGTNTGWKTCDICCAAKGALPTVISTRRSTRPGARGAPFHATSARMAAVSGRKSGSLPASSSFWRWSRRARSSRRLRTHKRGRSQPEG